LKSILWAKGKNAPSGGNFFGHSTSKIA